MMREVARFELRQQLRGHVFWVVFAISLVMVLGSVGVDALRVGLDRDGLRNGAAAIVQTHLVWTLFFMFTSAAFVADAVLRDELVGFAPIIRAAPVRWRDLVLGRFVGAFAAVLLCFLSVPLGILAGSAMPWVDPRSVGPIEPASFAFALVVLAVPNLLLSASVGFALATLSRSLGGALVGAVVLLVLYGLGARSGASLPLIAEPFGFAAYAEAVEGWSRTLRDRAVPGLAGPLALNRLLVLLASAVLLGVTAQVQPNRAGRQQAERADPADRGPCVRRAPAGPILRPNFRRQFTARLRLEVGQIVRTPVFAALLLLGSANAAGALWPLRGTAEPETVVRTLIDSFQLAPIVVALFFTGELRWMESERRIAGLLGATPLSSTAFLLAKFAAVAVVLVAITGVAGLSAFLLVGRAGALLPVWFAVACFNALVFAELAMFLQAIAPNKVAGWGFTILFLIAALALDRLGLTDPLYRFGRYPGWPYPPQVSGAAQVWPYMLYWGVVAVLLLATGVVVAGPARLTRRR